MAKLVCNPQEGATGYEIEINGIVLTPFASETDGSAAYLLDSSFESGTYIFRLRACNTNGVYGEWSPPYTAIKTAVGKVFRFKCSDACESLRLANGGE